MLLFGKFSKLGLKPGDQLPANLLEQANLKAVAIKKALSEQLGVDLGSVNSAKDWMINAKNWLMKI